jgi:two-component system, OmpR family, phosphate regulon response regulator OmpR
MTEAQHVLAHILVVDDDTRLRELLKAFLHDQHYFVTTASDAKDAARKMDLFQFDLIVLDVMMPGMTGIEFARSLPEDAPPILLLTAMAETEDRIAGLEAGADDYLPKPFDPRELVLRIQSILRRTASGERKRDIVSFGDYRFELSQGKLTRGGEMFALTTGESQLLKALAEHAGQAVTRATLAQVLGGTANERSVDVQITRLRKKIEADGSKPLFIQTVRGSGYMLYANEGIS